MRVAEFFKHEDYAGLHQNFEVNVENNIVTCVYIGDNGISTEPDIIDDAEFVARQQYPNIKGSDVTTVIGVLMMDTAVNEFVFPNLNLEELDADLLKQWCTSKSFELMHNSAPATGITIRRAV